MEDRSYGEKVRDALEKEPSREIKISFPKKVYKEFSEYAKDNSGDCYWLAIKELMESKKNKVDITNQVSLLKDRDDMIAMELKRLRDELEQFKATPIEEPVRSAFGRKDLGEKK